MSTLYILPAVDYSISLCYEVGPIIAASYRQCHHHRYSPTTLFIHAPLCITGQLSRIDYQYHTELVWNTFHQGAIQKFAALWLWMGHS